MAKINFNNEDREFENYGGKIKARHKKKRVLKVKRPSIQGSRISKTKKQRQRTSKYD